MGGGPTTLMEAIRVHSFGGRHVLMLQGISGPKPGPSQVLVRVAAAGVGAWDGWSRQGRRVLPQRSPLRPGSAISGVAEAPARKIVLVPGD